MLDGNRTLAAAALVGIEELDCVVIDEGFDPDSTRYRVTQWHANEHRQSLSPYDKAVAIRDIKADHPEMTNRQLAEEVLNIHPSFVTRCLALFKCDIKTQEEAKAGELTINEWYAQKGDRPGTGVEWFNTDRPTLKAVTASHPPARTASGFPSPPNRSKAR